MTVKNHDEDGTQASAAASLASLEDVTVPQQLDFNEDPSGRFLLELTEFGGREVAALEGARVCWDRAAALVAALDDDNDDDDDFALTCATSSLVNQGDDEDNSVGSARDAEMDDDVEVVGADDDMMPTSTAAGSTTGRVIILGDDDRRSPQVSENASMDALYEVFWARPFAEIAGLVAEPVRPGQVCEIKLWWEVLANLAMLIEDVTDVPAARVAPQSRFSEDLGVDSINAIEIGLHIEEVYRIRIPDEVLPSLYTVGDAVDYIAGQCGDTGRATDAATSPPPDVATPELPASAPTAALGRSARRRKAF